MISPDITISNHRLRWAVDGMRFTAPLHQQAVRKDRGFKSVQMLLTHTHTPSQSRVYPERQEEEKSGHQRRANGQNSARGGGEQTDLQNQPTRRNGPNQHRAHT